MTIFMKCQAKRYLNRQCALLLKFLQVSAFGDKGYLRKKLLDEILKKGLKLITRKRKNIKEKLDLSSHKK